MAMTCIDEILSHIATKLETHGRTHPGAKWAMKPDGKLATFNVEEFNSNPDMDWTRLDRIKNGLGYISKFTVQSENGSADPSAFSLLIHRGDGTPFSEEQGRTHTIAPVSRHFTAADKDQADRFTDEVSALFRKTLDDSYPKDLDPTSGTHESPASTAPKSYRGYQPSSIVGMFDRAVDTVLARDEFQAIEESAQEESMGRFRRRGYQEGRG